MNSFDSTLVFLEPLYKELFPENTVMIPIYEYPNCQEDKILNIPYNFDSTASVRVNQPDLDEVISILIKIMNSKDTEYYEPLVRLYQFHQDQFEKEWGSTFFKQKFKCQTTLDQIRIMHCFEHTLKFIDLVKSDVTNDLLIQLFDEYILKFFKSSVDAFDRYRIINEDDYHSLYFKKIKQKMIPINSVFGFYLGFLDRLEDHMIDKIKTIDSQMFYVTPQENLELSLKGFEVFFYLSIMDTKGSRKFEQALEDTFDEFAKTGYVIRIFEYAQNNKAISVDFTKFLLDKIFTHERFKFDLEIQQTFTGIIGYLINDHTRSTMKQYLFEKLTAKNTESRLRALSYLVYFTNEPDVLDLLINKAKQKNLSPEEVKILEGNFKRMLKAPDFPEESKDAVRQSLKKLPHEKQK